MTRLDKVIFIITLILSVFVILFSGRIFSGNTPKSVIIEVNGEIYGKYDLDGEKTSNILEIKTKYGYNKVVVEDKSVYVSESDCPEKQEILQGKIKNAGEMLVCVPNRLVIRIEGESEVDGLAY